MNETERTVLKAKRRHELKENLLAKDLAKARTWMSAHRGWVIGGPAVVVVIVLLILYVLDQRQSTRDAEYARYQTLTGFTTLAPADVRKDLIALAEETSQEALAALALLQAGRQAAQELVIRYTSLDAGARRGLDEEATEALQAVTDKFGENRPAASQAHLWLGRLAESRGEFDEAEQAYQRAADLWPEGAGLAALPSQAKLRLLRKATWPIVLPEEGPPRPPPASRPALWPTPGPALPTTGPTTGPAGGLVGPPATGPASRPASQPSG